MRILVVHAWLRGNLGDVLQLSVLLTALRRLSPATLDLAGYPFPAADGTADLETLVDRVLPDPFWWFWKFVPKAIADVAIAPRWAAKRRALFAGYDAVVCAPGPYLAAYDPRAVPALADIRIALDAGIPLLLASHSIGPLAPDQIGDVRRASVCVARESSTFDYLNGQGCTSVRAADYAFLYPYQGLLAAEADEPPFEVLFLRSDNLAARELRIDGGRLFHGERLLAGADGRQLVLATSDPYRDERFIADLAGHLGLRAVVCRRVPELVQLIGRSSAVVSDRYHPAICAAVLGKPVRVVPNREPHKMGGLTRLLADRSVNELQVLARTGLEAVRTSLMSIH